MTKLSLPVGKAGQRNRGWITGSGRHSGIDYGWYNADPTNSKRIYAAAPGTVIKVTNTSGWGMGWGSRVVIEHASGVRTTYSHFWKNGIKVRKGQKVVAGTYLGQMGGTGDSQGSHLHFELYLKGRRVNPDPYFKRDLPGTPTLASTTPAIEGNPVKTIYKTTTGTGSKPLWALGDDEALDPLNAGWVETRDTNVVSGQWAPRYGSFVWLSTPEFNERRTKFRAPRTTAPSTGGFALTDAQIDALATKIAAALKIPTAEENGKAARDAIVKS